MRGPGKPGPLGRFGRPGRPRRASRRRRGIRPASDACGGEHAARAGLPLRSTSCTSSTSARLTGASTPAADASRTTAPLRKSTSVGCPRRTLCCVDPRFGTCPIRRASARAAPGRRRAARGRRGAGGGRRAPAGSRSGCRGRRRRGRTRAWMRYHPAQSPVADDVLHAAAHDGRHRVDHVDDELGPLRPAEVADRDDRNRFGEQARRPGCTHRQAGPRRGRGSWPRSS